MTDRLRGGDGEASGGISGGCGDGFAGFFRERGEFVCIGEQGFTGCGERDAASAAIEEGDGELRLERLDLLGDGGLGEEEFFGCLAEVQVAGDGAEDAEAEIFHGFDGIFPECRSPHLSEYDPLSDAMRCGPPRSCYEAVKRTP